MKVTPLPQPLRNCRRLLRKHLTASRERLHLALDLTTTRFKQADLAIFHEFSPSPGGGGHQFLRALWQEFERRGLQIENNTISRTTRACLFNSFNFDVERLRRFRRAGCRMVHRVDGPIGVYRGRDDGTDQRIWQINQELADATIFQSHFSLQKHLDLGLQFRPSQVIMNAADPTIFHPQGRIEFSRQRKIRLIATSWSDNPNKGAAIYKWLEDHLDWNRFDFTFVGRSPIAFDRIQMTEPLPSRQLADLLRQHDIFITASRTDPCSNALIEALACGLPAIFLSSGGHPEIAGPAGFGFSRKEDIPDRLDQLVAEFEVHQAQISLPSLADVAGRYLAVMGVTGPC